MQFNETELRKAINLLKPNGQLYEIRIMCKKKVYTGYFDDTETLINALNKFEDNTGNVYFTLNELNIACKSRNQYGKFILGESSTTDRDVEGYDFLMVDLDPVRITGVSSSDDELEHSRKVANEVYQFMDNLGFEKPLRAYSGNGVHILYKINLANSASNVDLVKKCLLVLSMFFSDDVVKVDSVNFNLARICKMYGTVARKGGNTKERPHRMSRVIGDYDSLKPTDKTYLEKLAGMLPQEEKPQKYNSYSPSDFDLEEWMDKHNINYRKSSWSDGDKYILDCCPFDSSHKGKDACVFRSRGGSLGFRCFHNSCAGNGWKEFRLHFEPDAYEKRKMEQDYKRYHTFNRDKKIVPKSLVEEENKPIFYSANDILNLPHEEEVFIKTGTESIDKALRGLKKSYVSVISGCRASAKSTLLSQWILEAVDVGNNVGVYSGELSAKNFMNWLYLQGAGKSHVENGKYEGYYQTSIDTRKKIASWLDGHFWLYNNDYGNNFKAILEQLEKTIEEKKLDLLVLDNLMAFNITDLADTKWDAQTQFVLSLERLAKQHSIHIIFVAHPRKTIGFLRLDDISGTGDLANAVDNAFIVHRVNHDFIAKTKAEFGWKDDDEIYQATNVIEIAKDRDGGKQDVFVPLFYEVETKRLKNYLSENKIYGWDVGNDGFMVTDEDTPFV